MKPPVTEFLNIQLNDLETHFGGDVLTYFGTIVDGNENAVLRIVEGLALDPGKKEKLFVILTTTGGSATNALGVGCLYDYFFRI